MSAIFKSYVCTCTHNCPTVQLLLHVYPYKSRANINKCLTPKTAEVRRSKVNKRLYKIKNVHISVRLYDHISHIWSKISYSTYTPGLPYGCRTHINDTNVTMWKNKETNKSYCTSYTYAIARYNKMTTIHMYN